MDLKRKPAAQQRVDRLMAQRLCLAPDHCSRSCDELGGGCGRCSKHFGALKRELMNLPPDRKFAIRAKYILAGQLLDLQEIRKYPRPKTVQAG